MSIFLTIFESDQTGVGGALTAQSILPPKMGAKKSTEVRSDTTNLVVKGHGE